MAQGQLRRNKQGFFEDEDERLKREREKLLAKRSNSDVPNQEPQRNDWNQRPAAKEPVIEGPAVQEARVDKTKRSPSLALPEEEGDDKSVAGLVKNLDEDMEEALKPEAIIEYTKGEFSDYLELGKALLSLPDDMVKSVFIPRLRKRNKKELDEILSSLSELWNKESEKVEKEGATAYTDEKLNRAADYAYENPLASIGLVASLLNPTRTAKNIKNIGKRSINLAKKVGTEGAKEVGKEAAKAVGNLAMTPLSKLLADIAPHVSVHIEDFYKKQKKVKDSSGKVVIDLKTKKPKMEEVEVKGVHKGLAYAGAVAEAVPDYGKNTAKNFLFPRHHRAKGDGGVVTDRVTRAEKAIDEGATLPEAERKKIQPNNVKIANSEITQNLYLKGQSGGDFAEEELKFLGHTHMMPESGKPFYEFNKNDLDNSYQQSFNIPTTTKDRKGKIGEAKELLTPEVSSELHDIIADRWDVNRKSGSWNMAVYDPNLTQQAQMGNEIDTFKATSKTIGDPENRLVRAILENRAAGKGELTSKEMMDALKEYNIPSIEGKNGIYINFSGSGGNPLSGGANFVTGGTNKTLYVTGEGKSFGVISDVHDALGGVKTHNTNHMTITTPIYQQFKFGKEGKAAVLTKYPGNPEKQIEKFIRDKKFTNTDSKGNEISSFNPMDSVKFNYKNAPERNANANAIYNTTDKSGTQSDVHKKSRRAMKNKQDLDFSRPLTPKDMFNYSRNKVGAGAGYYVLDQNSNEEDR